MRGGRTDIDGIWSEAMLAAGLDAAFELRLGDARLASRERRRHFSGASMVKTLLAALIDADVRAGQLQLSRPVQVTASGLTDGAGLLRFGQIPTMHRLGDLVLLMVAVSDNTATNTLIDFLGGPEAVTARFAARGWTSTLEARVGDADAPEFSSVCLADHQEALASILHPLISAAFAAQQDRRSLARLVDDDADFRHKTGTADRVRHDAGVLATARGPLWVACFTDGGPTGVGVDHPACVAMGTAMRDTLVALGLAELTVPGLS
jgi:beta-lactamase class A